MENKYLFTSERLGFRKWKESDLDDFFEVTGDPEVMEFFPKILTREQTAGFIKHLIKRHDEWGYVYFAVEILDTGELIGFIGLADQTYEADFNPSTDIGWRLKKSAWGNGYATEGAKRCLEFGFEDVGLKRIIAVCSIGNVNSENVMKKIGMEKKGYFMHPGLKDYPDLEECVLYEILR